MSAAELVIAMGLATALLAVISVVYVFCTRSFVGLENYMEMNGKSRYALDRMSQEIRQADAISFYATNQISVLLGGTNVSFAYDADDKTLSRQSAGKEEVFLTGCDSLRFDIFQRNTTTNSFDLTPATSLAQGKVVQITWLCSRDILGKKATTENMQSAKVVLRRK